MDAQRLNPARPGRGEWLALLGLLALAAVLRLGWPGLTEFKADEAHLLALSLDMVDGAFPLQGITSSVGLPNFPISVWLYAAPLIVSRSATAATLFTGLVNVLAIAGSWWLARRLWGREAAWIATLMWLVSPWSIHHARKIWAQNLLPPLVVGWAVSGALTFLEGRARWLAAHLALLGAAAQVHLAGLALVPATLLYLLLFRRRVRARWLLLGALLACLPAVPLLVALWPRLNAGSPVGATLGFDWGLEPLRLAWELATGQGVHALAGGALPAYRDLVPAAWPAIVLWGALQVGGLLWLGRVARVRRGSPAGRAALFVLIWAIAPLLFFIVRVSPVVLHYLLPIFPAPFLAAGAAGGALLGRFPAVRRPAIGALLIGAAWQVWLWVALLLVVAAQPTPGGFGLPLRYYTRAADAARELFARHGAQEIIVAGAGEFPALDTFAAVYDALLRDLPRRFVDARQEALFPAAPAVVVAAPRVAGDLLPAYAAAAAEESTVRLRSGEGEIALWLLPAEAGPAPARPLEPSALFANWIVLEGFDPLVLTGPDAGAWRLTWRPGANPDPRDYHFFNHLLVADGARVAQADGPAFDPGQWRQGDLVLSLFRLPLPDDLDGPLTMRVGLYVYPSVDNVPLLDVAGNPAADAVELPATP